MPPRIRGSRVRFQEYKRDLQRRLAEGSFRTRGHREGPVRVGSTGRSFLKLVRAFWGLCQGQRSAIVLALVTLSFSTLLKLIPPAATKITIDYVLGDRPLPANMLGRLLPGHRGHLLIVLALAVVLISVVDSSLGLWGRWHATRATKRVQSMLRRRVFDHAVRLPLHRVHQLKSGGLASLIRQDAGDTVDLIFAMLYNPWRAILQLLGSLAILAWVDWRLLLGSLVLVPLVFLTHRTWIGRIRPLHGDIRKLRQEIDSQVTEVFGGMRVVRAFARQRSESLRSILLNHLMARQELHAWGWARTIDMIWDVVIPAASAGLLLYGGFRVLSGQLSLGDLMMFLVYLMMLLGPLGVLASSATQFQSSLAALDRVLDILAEPQEMPDPPHAVVCQPHAVIGRIVLNNVSYRYPGSSELALKDIQLEIPPGCMIALVGPSGAGKTTLCNLVARFFDPISGSIEFDGIDLRNIRLQSYRRLLGIVEQEIFLFDGTVAENIGYADRHATATEIERAARLANAHEFITGLEKGYDTLVGERGVRLSGGERQRLAIARAVLADPRILILDEATSNLDTASERLIQQSLHELMRDRTTLVIAHRLSTIAHAQRIVVLEAGCVCEVGTHRELMAVSGRYRRMVSMQTGVANVLIPTEMASLPS